MPANPAPMIAMSTWSFMIGSGLPKGYGRVTYTTVTFCQAMALVRSPRMRAAERTARTRSNVLRQLEKLVAWGIEQRGGPKDLDSELFARLLMEMAEDSARLILTQPKKFTIDRIVTFAALLMSAVRRDTTAGVKPPPQLR